MRRAGYFAAQLHKGIEMNPFTPAAPRWLLPLSLSLVAGAVDAIGFLGIGGLFAAR